MVNSESPAIDISDLRVRRGKLEVLHDLSVCVPRGEVVGLLGPSGSGKSTLMRSIVGAQRITTGTVTVLGLPAGTSALRKRIGYVTQAASDLAEEQTAQTAAYSSEAAISRKSLFDYLG